MRIPNVPAFLRVFIAGFMISFLGSLPLGTLNVAAMQIAIADGVLSAFLFSLGSLTAEMIYVRLSLIAMDWIRKQHKIFRVLEWITFFIVLALAVSSFYGAMHPKVHKNIILNSSLNKYLLGLVMSAINPVQIPFWFGWSTVLFSKKILIAGARFYNIYILGIGIGTFLGNFIFIFGGRLIAASISAHEEILSWVIGIIFLLTSIIQFIKIVRKKDSQHQLEHPEEITDKFSHKLDADSLQ